MLVHSHAEETEFIHKRPLKEDIFDVLHEKVIAGIYKPGDWLRQEDIATQLGVSMTPVREALDLLVSAGLAERVPYRGVRVREMSTKDIVEAYGLRLVLEAIIAQEAAKNITPDQLTRLEQMLEETKKHDTLEAVSSERKSSREFHSAIAEATKNDLLIKLYAVVANAFPDWLLYEALFRYPELISDSMAGTYREHIAIVDALKTGDSEGAAKQSIAHLMESGKWLEEYLEIPAELLREKEEQVTSLLKK
ncbi:MAG TPA: GntR family transcriptional regulator [Anaerolineales bacterium]|jgi:DNA-binding GntR family transcriptional regulator|nr:GntR family transcriptional regulator [Anaerolineales bacterium]